MAYCLIAWAITWSIFDLSSKVFCDFHLREISQEVLMNWICNLFRDYTFRITITYPRRQWVKIQSQTNGTGKYLADKWWFINMRICQWESHNVIRINRSCNTWSHKSGMERAQFLYTVWCCCNTINFVQILHKDTPYGVSFVNLNLDLYSALVNAVVCEISCFTGPLYNSTRLYL